MDTRNGNPEDVFAAREVLWSRSDSGHSLPLVDLLARFIRVGKLSIEEDCERGLVLSRVSEGGLLVRHTVLQKLLKQEGIAMPNPIKITGALAQENVLIENREDAWVIHEDWFEQRQRYISAMAAGPMGVVSA